MSVTTLFPAAFPALVLAHFVALLSPGQDFFLIVGHSVRHRLKGSQYICLGVALGNAAYIAIAILGWTNFRDNTALFKTIEIFGALYLLWVGAKLVKSKRYESLPFTEENAIPSRIKQLLLGMNSALLNPKNALFYMSLMVVILGSEVTVIQQTVCGIWMFLAVLLWDLLVASVIGQSRIQCYLQRSMHIIEKGAGVILISFGVSLFIA